MASWAVVSARANGELSDGGRPLVLRQRGEVLAQRLGLAAAGVRQGDVGVADVELQPPRAGLLRLRVGDVAHALAVPHEPHHRRARCPVATLPPPPSGREMRPSRTPVAAAARRRNRGRCAGRMPSDDRCRPTCPVLAFPDQAAFEAWLEAEHATAPGVYVKLAKKGAGVPSVTYAELVESLLCFGWIDGRANRLDDRFYLQRITPRRAKSVWSQKNVDAVEALMPRPAGCARRAGRGRGGQADGRWERAYAGAATSPCRTTSPRRWPPSPRRSGSSRPWTAPTATPSSGGCTPPGSPATRAKRIATPRADAGRGPPHPLTGDPRLLSR